MNFVRLSGKLTLCATRLRPIMTNPNFNNPATLRSTPWRWATRWLQGFCLIVGLALAPLALSAANTGRNGETPPVVVTSINPLRLILAEAFGDLVTVSNLLPPNQSPHGYALRPSDAERLGDADLILWVGPTLETFLTKVLARHGQDKVVPVMERLRQRQPGLLMTYDHPDTKASPDERTYLDPHIWLGRDVALEIAAVAADEIVRVQPSLREDLSVRLSRFKARLAELPRQTSDLGDVVLVSYHSAFRYLARDLGLTIDDVIIRQADLTPGARHFSHLQAAFEERPHCLMTEPQFRHSRLLARLGELATATVELDPLGGSADSYTALYRQWVEGLRGCRPHAA